MRLIKGAFSAQVGAALLNEHAAKLVASAKNKEMRNMSDSLSIDKTDFQAAVSRAKIIASP